MKSRKKNKRELPIIRINKELDKYEGKVLFPEKVEKANEMLKKTKLPDEFYNKKKP